ncbi:hypothetical protein [Geothrix fuzhouensis]|uniref:hypothetical protein n=1 Tax=Geothrix fuzhouensis TaxID=2966451 RepID=UPI0021473836|nr:hypothetical protein [Geothrix fuzhouensis]
MLDLLLIPAAILLGFALRAVRRGEYRLHGHLMMATFTVIGLRVILHPRGLGPLHLALWLAVLVAAGSTMLLGRAALAWREGRSERSGLPRVHRAAGALTLVLAVLTLATWFLRNHR